MSRLGRKDSVARDKSEVNQESSSVSVGRLTLVLVISLLPVIKRILFFRKLKELARYSESFVVATVEKNNSSL